MKKETDFMQDTEEETQEELQEVSKPKRKMIGFARAAKQLEVLKNSINMAIEDKMVLSEDDVFDLENVQRYLKYLSSKVSTLLKTIDSNNDSELGI